MPQPDEDQRWWSAPLGMARDYRDLVVRNWTDPEGGRYIREAVDLVDPTNLLPQFMRQGFQRLPTAPSAADRPPVPMQANGLPDLSGVGTWGQGGFTSGLQAFGPGMARDALPYAAGPLGGLAGRAARAIYSPTRAAVGGLLAAPGLALSSTPAGDPDEEQRRRRYPAPLGVLPGAPY